MIYRAVPEPDLDSAVEASFVGVEAQTGAATVAIGLTKRCIQRGLTSTLARRAMEAEANALELDFKLTRLQRGLDRASREARRLRFEGR